MYIRISTVCINTSETIKSQARMQWSRKITNSHLKMQKVCFPYAKLGKNGRGDPTLTCSNINNIHSFRETGGTIMEMQISK